MENLRKRVDVRLVTDEKKLDKLTSNPTYGQRNIDPKWAGICGYVYSRP